MIFTLWVSSRPIGYILGRNIKLSMYCSAVLCGNLYLHKYFFEPLRFHRVNLRSHRSEWFIPAYLFCIPFMISFRKHCCSLPTAFFLSSVCQSTDVETVRCFLNACIICCASGDIQAPAMEERYRVSPSLNTLLQFLVYVYSLQPSRVIV